MTQEEQILFFEKVKLLRHHQRLYVQFKSGSDLDKMKALQREVDSMIIKEVKIQKSKQPELFRR